MKTKWNSSASVPNIAGLPQNRISPAQSLQSGLVNGSGQQLILLQWVAIRE